MTVRQNLKDNCSDPVSSNEERMSLIPTEDGKEGGLKNMTQFLERFQEVPLGGVMGSLHIAVVAANEDVSLLDIAAALRKTKLGSESVKTEPKQIQTSETSMIAQHFPPLSTEKPISRRQRKKKVVAEKMEKERSIQTEANRMRKERKKAQQERELAERRQAKKNKKKLASSLTVTEESAPIDTSAKYAINDNEVIPSKSSSALIETKEFPICSVSCKFFPFCHEENCRFFHDPALLDEFNSSYMVQGADIGEVKWKLDHGFWSKKLHGSKLRSCKWGLTCYKSAKDCHYAHPGEILRYLMENNLDYLDYENYADPISRVIKIYDLPWIMRPKEQTEIDLETSESFVITQTPYKSTPCLNSECTNDSCWNYHSISEILIYQN